VFGQRHSDGEDAMLCIPALALTASRNDTRGGYR